MPTVQQIEAAVRKNKWTRNGGEPARQIFGGAELSFKIWSCRHAFGGNQLMYSKTLTTFCTPPVERAISVA